MGDSQASFSASVKNALRQRYANRCAICLLVLPTEGAQSAHLFDITSSGADQVSTAQTYGLLDPKFQRNSDGNGFLQCLLCHMAFFTPNHVALSPSTPVLQYIDEYLEQTAVADQLPLYQLFQLLRDTASGVNNNVHLPLDPTDVLPYLDLFSLVVLNPTHVTGLRIPTLYLPQLFSLQNGQFRPMRTRAAISARIFDVIAAAAGDTTISFGFIPLSAEQDEFNVQRYWRLPINTEIILALLINRTLLHQSQSNEINLARKIFGWLLVQYSDKGEPKKKRRHTEKGDAPNEDLGLGFLIEERIERASDQSLISSCERPHYGVDPKEWDVATAFSTLAEDEIQEAKADFGHLTPSNRESDCGEDVCSEWRFGPLLSSTMIITSARQMMNI